MPKRVSSTAIFWTAITSFTPRTFNIDPTKPFFKSWYFFSASPPLGEGPVKSQKPLY